MSDAMGECGCCESPLQQRWSMAFHQWWGDQVQGAPNSQSHYLRRIFTYTYHVEFKHGDAVIASWDWVDQGQIDQSKWTGENTVTDFTLQSGLRCPAYVLFTMLYGDTSLTSFAPSFDYPPPNFDSYTGSLLNNWYTLQAWWGKYISLDLFFFSGIPITPQPGDFRQLALDTIADVRFIGLGLSTANIGEYSWGIRLKTELRYDLTQYYSRQDFLLDFAAIKARVSFTDIKSKTKNQGTYGAYHFYYTTFFYNQYGQIVERNAYELAAINPYYSWWASSSPTASKYTERIGGGALSGLIDLRSGSTAALWGGEEISYVPQFYSAIDCVLDVIGPTIHCAPQRDGSSGTQEASASFGGIYLISTYPVPTTEASFCMHRYASDPDAVTNNANSDQYGSIRNGALWVDSIEKITSNVTFPNPGAANFESQCSGGWTHEIITRGACE